MTATASEWRTIGGEATAWFDASSLVEAAAFAARIVELSAGASVDVRSTGVRVRLGGDQRDAVSAAAQDLGLIANPAVMQQMSVVFDSANPTEVWRFWERVLGYEFGDDGSLVDPLRRDPALRFRVSTDKRPLRHRIHLDVVRPAGLVAAIGLGDGSGPYGVCHTDSDGNEVDLVPGDPLGDSPGTADWRVVFGAVACYRVASPEQARDVAVAAAALAAGAGFPLLIDLRPGLVVIDSGKDQWDGDAYGLDLDFGELAAGIQTAARDLGAVADPGPARFVQLFLDAADVDTVRAFWLTALGYVADRRAGVTDIFDPRRLNPVLVFQELDAADTDRRRQRNRIHIELAVPADMAPARVEQAVAAGGRVIETPDGCWHVADPEGNELVIIASR